MPKRLLVVLFSVVFLLLPAILTACSNITEKENAMVLNKTLPRIDTNAPARTETATFSLG